MTKRQAKKLEPITLDDLLGNSSMEGLVSFLDLPAHSPSLPRLNKRVEPIQQNPPPTVANGISPTVPSGNQQSSEALCFRDLPGVGRTPLGTAKISPPPTVDIKPVSTDPSEPGPNTFSMAEGGTKEGDTWSLSTVGIDYIQDRQEDGPYPVPTVIQRFGTRSVPSLIAVAGGNHSERWITEEGQLVSVKQVRPFKLAQEVLNANERALYSVLWNSKEARLDPSDPNTKVVRAGYETLAKRTNMAKKTIQRLIPRLLSKNFIEISESPNFFNRTPASYKVFSFRRVLEVCAEQGRGHVAKLGHGVAFARPYSIEPVPSGPPPTVGIAPAPTIDPKAPSTGYNDPLTTVGGRSTILRTSKSKGENNRLQLEGQLRNLSPSSSLRETPPNTLVQGLRSLLIANRTEIDNDATQRLWNECRTRVPDCTADEVLHFTRAKTVLFSTGKINNPVGFLLFAVPKCFEGASFQEFRKEQEQVQRAEQEQAQRAEQEMEEVRRQLVEMLHSPTATEEDRKFAQRLLSES